MESRASTSTDFLEEIPELPDVNSGTMVTESNRVRETLYHTNHEFPFDDFNSEHNLDNDSFAVHETVFSSSDEEILFPHFSDKEEEENGNNSKNNNNLNESPSSDKGQKRKHEDSEKLLTRKRLSNPQNWKRNVLKKAVNTGQQYLSSYSKKTVEARSMQRTCGPGCKFQCENKISESARQTFFDDYWSIMEQARKYDFILRHVSESCDQENLDDNQRIYRKIYTINDRNNKIKVCQTMFLNTLNISKQTVSTALTKLRNNDSTLIDKRGTSKSRPRAINEDITANVIEHINSFPRVESHYVRKNTSREYLEESLSLGKMYNLYTELMKEENKPIATKHYYCDIFNTKFNIGFFKPKKDQCDLCEEFKSASDEQKEKLTQKYNEHIKNKEISREIKEAEKIIAKKNKNISLICFDFEKVLTTPKTDVSTLYYKRKLSVYNFTVYDIGRHEATCYVWSENDAKKGSNEVASCLLHYIDKKSSEGITVFFMWSDNCAGQNRNRNVFSMYVYASAKFNVNIKHSFLEVGHTQNEGDSVHARIKRHSKGRKIFTLEEWCDIIRTAKLSKPIYQVVNVTYNMVYDFKNLSAQMNWSKSMMRNNRKQTIKVPISKIKQVSALREKNNQFQYKTSFTRDFETLVTRIEKFNVNVKKYTLRRAYSNCQGVPKAKLNDFKTLCRKNTIPPKYHDYYNSFPEKITIQYSSDDESEEE